MPEQKLIGPILEELNVIIEMIGKTKSIGELPAIERDIILEKLRQIYAELSDSNPIPEIADIQNETEEAAVTEPEIEATEDTLELEEPVEEIDEEPEEVNGKTEEEEKVTDEVDDKPEPEKEFTKKAVETIDEVDDKPVEKEPKKEKESQEGIIAEKLTGDKQFVYDTLAENSSKDNVSSKLQSKPISNISSAIGINDKFKLIRDLFNGDSNSFNNTLKFLDGATNFNEAFTYLNETFDWDMEDPSVQLILDLVRRKFIVKKDE